MLTDYFVWSRIHLQQQSKPSNPNPSPSRITMDSVTDIPHGNTVDCNGGNNFGTGPGHRLFWPRCFVLSHSLTKRRIGVNWQVDADVSEKLTVSTFRSEMVKLGSEGLILSQRKGRLREQTTTPALISQWKHPSNVCLSLLSCLRFHWFWLMR